MRQNKTDIFYKRLYFGLLPLGVFLFMFGMFWFSNLTFAAENHYTQPPVHSIKHIPFHNGQKQDAIDIQSNGVHDYVSPEFQSGEIFNGAGIHWKGDSSQYKNISFFLSFSTQKNNTWTPWEQLEYVSDNKDASVNNVLYTNPIFTDESTKVRYKMQTNSPNVFLPSIVDEIEIIYFNTQTQKDHAVSKISASAPQVNTTGELKIISREEWGADESYRFTASGAELWPAAKEPVKKFIIHHTAGGSGGSDPAATVRGIYYWHAVVLGWGDIGYNFIIDQQGNVYEGRYGGDNVIGGHTYNSSLNINYNVGSAGVALMGCFEDDKEGCTAKDQLTKKTRRSLTELIAYKSISYKISPKGTGDFFGKQTANVIGHRDVDYTLCPGSNVEEKISNIANNANKRYKQILQAQHPYEAKFISNNIHTATFTGDASEIEITLKNVGTENWTRENVFLSVYDLDDQVSKYFLESWENEYGKFTLPLEIVKPQEEVTFTFQEKTPRVPGLYRQIFKIWNGEDVMIQGRMSLVTRADSHYKAHVISHNIPPALLSSWRPKIRIRIQNIGAGAWDKNFALHITDLGGAKSQFYDKSWPKSDIAAYAKEGVIQPGQKGTFVFTLQPPKSEGLFLNEFTLSTNDENVIVEDGKFSLITRVEE